MTADEQDELRRALELSGQLNRKLMQDVMRMRKVLLEARKCLISTPSDMKSIRARARIDTVLRESVR